MNPQKIKENIKAIAPGLVAMTVSIILGGYIIDKIVTRTEGNIDVDPHGPMFSLELHLLLIVLIIATVFTVFLLREWHLLSRNIHETKAKDKNN